MKHRGGNDQLAGLTLLPAAEEVTLGTDWRALGTAAFWLPFTVALLSLLEVYVYSELANEAAIETKQRRS